MENKNRFLVVAACLAAMSCAWGDVSNPPERFHAPQKMLQYKRDGDWITIFTESGGDGELDKTFDPVTARHFRLVLKNAPVHISEFQLFQANL